MSKYLVRMADKSVARLAARNVAEDEYWHGHTDRRKWALAVLMSGRRNEAKFPGAYLDGNVYRTIFHDAPIAHRYKTVETYCRLREKSIYTDALNNGNPDLVREIRRVKKIVWLHKKQYQLDVINNTSRHTKKYWLILLFVILVGLLI